MEYATVYKYSGGFHEFGKFLSFASGYEKIINVSDIVMTRDSSKSVSNAAIEFRLSIFVYDPKSVVAAKAKPAAAKPGKEKEEED
jgi:Tfp pilus assembly protein PilO